MKLKFKQIILFTVIILISVIPLSIFILKHQEQDRISSDQEERNRMQNARPDRA